MGQTQGRDGHRLAPSHTRTRAHTPTLFLVDAPQSNSAVLDTSQVFTRGFSQNSMFAVYIAVCFADKVAGVWQGGSGLAFTGSVPIVPGAQAQCKLSDALADGGTAQCCAAHFCTTCKYWPLYPQTCAATRPERKLVDCIMAYTDDSVACGSDYYMYQASRMTPFA